MSEPLADDPQAHESGQQEIRADVCRYCPNCSAQLVALRCKLKCPLCDFYLSCSDFY